MLFIQLFLHLLAAISDVVIPVHAIKGRGAAARLAHRFEKNLRAGWDDGWGTLEAEAAKDSPGLETQLSFEDARSAIVRNDSPDIFLDYTLNPYRGFKNVCIHDVRGGKHYNSDSASRLKGSGLWADLIKQRFEKT